MDYRIEKKDIIKGVGVTKVFSKKSSNTESDNWKEQMGESWEFWNDFLNNGKDSVISNKYKLYKAPFWQMGVTHTLENGDILECIGAEAAGENYPELEHFEIPASTWAVFTAKGSLNNKVHPIDVLTTRIFSEWFPSSGYEKSMDYEIQVYGPGDTSSEDYTCELWIPVKKK